jgi:uncharacterized protein (DUF433 family)
MSVSYLERPVYTMTAVDQLLNLKTGTARRWIDGYERQGKLYLPVVREESTGVEDVTWGEFVETRQLAGFRESGVSMQRMRPVVDGLRQRFGVRYPLATVQPYVDKEHRVVYEVQEQAHLEQSMRLVVEASRGQYVLSPAAREVHITSDYDDVTGDVMRIHPLGTNRGVVIDPERQFGSPIVRGTRTEVLVELFRAGEPVEWIAEQYDLDLSTVLDAIEYERRTA